MSITPLQRRKSKKPLAMLRDPKVAALVAQLRYVSLDEPGYRRVKRGRGVIYLRANGSKVKHAKELKRIASLAIPPAWENVWICTCADGHIQAVGHDARGRKQYRYHPRWREVRDQAKYHQLSTFGQLLPQLRERLQRDLSLPGLSKTKVVAAVVKIMERTQIRVGNERYTSANGSYGLTTLLDKHVKILGSKVEFSFRGKGGKARFATLQDSRLAKIVQRCQDIPGQRLFQYLDEDGERRAITSTDVNEYLRRATEQPFSAKIFRTWAASCGALWLLYQRAPCPSERKGKSTVLEVIDAVAPQLGNTRTICRNCYIQPLIVESYMRGDLHKDVARALVVAQKSPRAGLTLEECTALAFFQSRSVTSENFSVAA